MLIYDKKILAETAKDLHVARDTLEKVYRLRNVLEFFDSSEVLRDALALKGGTAINLLFFNLPRLSVDIDLDFCKNISKNEMMGQREAIKNLIDKYMTAEGYALSPKSKNPLSLDSMVYDYVNSGGTKDSIKIEINYSLRSHVLPVERMNVQSEYLMGDFLVNTVSAIEIYATKTVALLTRTAARDLYDLNYMVRYGLFDEQQLELYRKCVIFYLAVATKSPIIVPDYTAIDAITPHKITTDLYPVIRDRDAFRLEDAKKDVCDFLKENIHISEKEISFLKSFKNGKYRPDLLFEEEEILNRIKNHPMAIWKTKQNLEL